MKEMKVGKGELVARLRNGKVSLICGSHVTEEMLAELLIGVKQKVSELAEKRGAQLYDRNMFASFALATFYQRELDRGKDAESICRDMQDVIKGAKAPTNIANDLTEATKVFIEKMMGGEASRY